MKSNKVKALIDGGVCTLLSLVMVMLGNMIPLLSSVAVLLAGVPMMYLGLRRGVKILSASWMLAVVLLSLFSRSVLNGILIGVMNFLPGMLLGYTLRVRKSFATIIFSGAAALLLGIILQLAIFNHMTDGNGIVDMINQFLVEVQNEMNVIFQAMEGQLQGKEGEMQQIISQTLEQTKNIIFLYLPSFVIGFAVVTSYLLFMVSAFLLQRIFPIKIGYRPFWEIYAPKPMAYLGLLMIFFSFSEDPTIWTGALHNVVLLTYAYFGICGLSLLDYKFRKKISSGYIRGAVYAVVFCVGYLFLGFILRLLCMLGAIDGLINFRIREGRMGHE